MMRFGGGNLFSSKALASSKKTGTQNTGRQFRWLTLC